MGASFVVDCMKNERFTALWELEDADQNVVTTLANASELVSAPYAVWAGLYTVKITASLWSSLFDLTDMTVGVTYCVNVTASGLVTGIEGSGFVSAAFNGTVELFSYSLTYDPAVPSTSDKSGMILEWRCKRSSEAWPPAPLAIQSYVPNNRTGEGCFGDVGPGVLGFADGLWNLSFSTGYLEPLVNYDVQFVVSKDVRSASADVTVFVQQPLAPVLSTRLYLFTYCRTFYDRKCPYEKC